MEDSSKVSQSIQKSKHLDIRLPLSSCSAKRGSERFENHNTLTPLGRSVCGKKNLLSCSSDLKQCAKELSLSQKMNKKKLIQKTVEFKKPGVQLESFCGKRKKMTGRTFKALFKRPRIPGLSLDSNLSQSLQRESINFNRSTNQMAVQSSFSSEVDICQAEESGVLSDEQKSLRSSLQDEIVKLCQILKLSEDVTHKVKSFLEFVILNHQFNRDSPEIMQALQISLCWIAASTSKQTEVHKKESLVLAKQLLNYQCTEEQAHTVYSTMLDLKKIFLQRSLNSIDSGRDCLSADEDINNETSNVNEGSNANKEKSPFPSCKQKNVKMVIKENSANGERCEGEIVLQPKVAPKDKDAGSEIYGIMNKIQKKCDKRMKKLISKQKEEIQNFHCIWEEKILKLETDHKLESAIIRSIHGEGSARQDKLKLLSDNFAKKMEENNLLKRMQLEDLEAKQLASRNEERQKRANWLAQAKLYSSGEVRGLCQQSDEDAGFSQSSEHILADRDLVPITAHVAPPDTAVGAPAEEVGCIAPIGTPNNLVSINHENETGETCSERLPSPVLEQLNQPKHFGTGEIILSNLPCVGDTGSVEMLSVELDEEVEQELPPVVPNETAGYVNLVEFSGASNKEDAAGLLLAGRSRQTETSPNRCELLPPQVPDDQIHQSLVSAEVQDQCTQAVERQHTSLFEVAPSEVLGSATVLHSNLEPQDQNALATESQSTSQIEVAILELVEPVTVQSHMELNDQAAPALEDQGTLQIEEPNLELVDTETHTQSNVQAQETENCNQLHPVIDISPDQSPVIEIEDQTHALGINSSQTTEAETEVLPESASQVGVDLEIPDNHIDIVSVNRIDNETSVQPSASPQDVSMSQGTVQIEEPNLERVGTEMHMQSNVQAQETKYCNQLHPVINISPDQSPVIEIEDQSHALGRNSSQTAEAAETEVLPHESASQIGVDSETQGNQIDIVSANRNDHETSVQHSASPQNNVSMPQGVNVGHFYGFSYPFSTPNHQVASWNHPSFFAEPLQKELDKICKETEQLQKSHNDMMSRLRSDCEKEIEEISAQIRKKYDMKLQDAKADFRLKKNGLDKNKNKLFMNKVLAEVMSHRCLYPSEPNYAEMSYLSSGLQQMQQVIPSSSMRHMHQQSLQHSTRHRHSPSQQITNQTVESMQQLSLPQSTRPHQLAHQHFQNPVAHTNAINSAGNLPFGGPFYPPTQHIQAFRPATASSVPPSSFSHPAFFPPLWRPLLGVPQLPSNPQNRPQPAPFDPSRIGML